MFAQSIRAPLLALGRWPSVLAAILAVPFSACALLGQSVIIRITPGGGNYPVGWQVALHVEFCITDPNEHFYNGGTVLFNDVPVAGAQGGSAPGCLEFQSADVAGVTLVDGTNTVAGTVTTFIGQSPDEVYPSTDYALLFTPATPPALDMAPHNGYNRNAALCVAACFNTVAGYTTPVYWTLDAPRAVSLFYSSGQVESRHTVEFAATNMSSVLPNYVTAKLRRPDLSYVTLTNGSTVVSFVPPGSGSHRYAFQFEDSTLATGAYDYTLVVGGDWGSEFSEASIPIRVLVINERTSPYGAGWSVAGVQRIILGPGDSLATWDGAGTVQFWRRTSCVGTTCTYGAPPGEFDQLQRLGMAPNFSYVRTMVDGTKLNFDVFGRLLSVADVFGWETLLRWKQSDVQRLDTIIDPAGKKIAFTYDGSNRLATIRDLPGNRTTSFTVNAQNNLIQVQDAAGGKPFQQATYDSFHRLLARLDRRGARWASTYDMAGQLATDSTPAVTADGVSQRLVTLYRSFNAAALSAPDSGGIGTVTPPAASQRQYRVDVFGALLELLAPLSELGQYTRNGHGQVTEARDSTGWTTFTWNGPRLTARTNVITSAVTSYEWNASTNRLTRVYGGGAKDTRYFYGGTGFRLDSMRVGSGTPSTRYSYDGFGRVLSVTDPKGHVTQFFRSSADLRNTDSTREGSRRIAFYHDALGRVVVFKDAMNRSDTAQYDTLNRVKRTAGPLGQASTFTYGDSLNLTRVTDGMGRSFGIEKNAIGWDTAHVDPAGLRDVYRYDGVGHVVRWINRRGQTTAYSYDGTGRLLRDSLSDGRMTEYTYGPTWMAASNAEGTDTVRWVADTSYEISVRGGVAHRVRSFHNTAQSYRTTDVWRDGPNQPVMQVKYDLDSAGQVWRISYPGSSYLDTLRYSPEGLLSRVALHGVDSTRFLVRPGHDLAGVTHSRPAYQSSFAYSYVSDTIGRVAEVIRSNQQKFDDYTYDALGRLTAFHRWLAAGLCPATDTLSEFGTRCSTAGAQQVAQDTFAYDPAGNRTDGSALVDNAGRLLRLRGDSMLYDSDGNMIRKLRIADTIAFNQRLFWNSVGRLDSVRTVKQGVAVLVRFGYDGFGRRVRKTVGSNTTHYVHSQDHVVAEYSSSGSLQRHYSYYPGTDFPHTVWISGTRFNFMNDGRGNIAGLTTADGQSIYAIYRYNPYGDADSTYEFSVTNNVRFAGRELDPETGLYYMRARYYDPQIGRFISEDPIGLSGGLNPYSYGDNDPVNLRDPSGQCAPICVMVVGGAIAGAIIGGVSYYLNSKANHQKFSWGKFLGATVWGAGTGALAGLGGFSIALGAPLTASMQITSIVATTIVPAVADVGMGMALGSGGDAPSGPSGSYSGGGSPSVGGWTGGSGGGGGGCYYTLTITSYSGGGKVYDYWDTCGNSWTVAVGMQ